MVKFSDVRVQSQPILLPGHEAQCFISGRFDTVVEFADGSYGIVDFKTSEPRPSHVAFYGRQLHAYAYALEHPAAAKMALSPIKTLGLLTVSPDTLERIAGGRIAYVGDVDWKEIPLDFAGFLSFLDGVMSILESPETPPPGEDCAWCSYRGGLRLV